MKPLLAIFISSFLLLACGSNSTESSDSKQDTLEIVPGYGGGQEPGTGGTNAPSYPTDAMPEQADTAPPRGMHGANVDTTVSPNK